MPTKKKNDLMITLHLKGHIVKASLLHSLSNLDSVDQIQNSFFFKRDFLKSQIISLLNGLKFSVSLFT